MRAIEWWRNRLGVSKLKVETEDSFYTECPLCHANGDTLHVEENLKARRIAMKCDACGADQVHVCDRLCIKSEMLILETVSEFHVPHAKRPPLGIEPRYVWEEKRRQKIRKAVMEYMNAGLMVPEAWIEEWNELTSGGREDLIGEQLED